jgi:YVTN family beta-propeller protein
VRYGILGPLEVRDGERTVALAQGRQRLLLTVLLLHANRAVSSDRLIDALWGEAPPVSATGSLHNLVSGLRKALGAGRLVTQGRGYLLQVADEELDARRFDALSAHGRAALAADQPGRAAELLRDALALWRGPAFGDLAYEAALQDGAASLEERRLGAVEDRVDADLALGRHAELIAELDRLVAENPLRERLRGQQMLALYRSGRQADALRAYADARRQLVEQLGIEPGPGLRALERAVLEQDPALGGVQALPRQPRSASVPGRAPRRWWLAVGGAMLLALTVGALLLARQPRPDTTGAGAAAGDMLVAIDAATNRVVERATVGGTPTSVAVGAGAVWALNADDRTVSRLDLESGTVRSFSGEAAPVDLAAGTDVLWVAQAHPESDTAGQYVAVGSVARVDPLSGAGRGTTVLPVPAKAAVSVLPSGLIAAGDRAVWALARPGWVHRIDVDTGRLRTWRSLQAQGIATGDGQVWIRDFRNRAIRLDPDSGRVIASVPLPVYRIDALAFGESALWLTDSSEGTVWRVDPERLAVRTIAVDEGGNSVAAGAGAVWVANSVRGTVTRIDAVSNRVTATIPVGGTPSGIAVGGDRVWVSVAGAARAAPAAGGLSANARVEALPAPPCGPVLTDGSGDPDVLVASQLPLGESVHTTLPMAEAVAYVLREHRFRAGRFTIGYQICDDASAQIGVTDLAKCRRNARTYVANPAVVGIVGPFISDCARVMLPILNRAAERQPALVSPTNSSPDLVRSDPAAPDDVLAELYPTGQRGYGRVYPADDYEVAAGAMLAHRLGRGRVFFLEDREVGAVGPKWRWFRRAAERIGLRIAGRATWSHEETDFRRLAERVRASGVRAVYINSGLPANLGGLLRDLREAVGPDVAIIGPLSLTPVAQLFADAGSAARGVLITSPGLTPQELGAQGTRFVRGFGATHPGGVTNFAVYAAAATEVLLDAIARSDGTRASVVRALSHTRLRDSVLGPLALAPNGEPIPQPITVLRAEHGRGRPDIVQGLDGAVPVDIIEPPAGLVGATPRG